MRTNLQQSGPWIGVGGMVVVLFLYGYSAVARPSWVDSLLLPLLWLLLFGLALRWFSRRPYAVLALPVVALAAWFAAMLVGR